MATTGTATLDFGAFPGASDASVAVTGQAAIVAGSYVECWIRPVATADHTADEHMVETIKVIAGNISAGVGFTIYGFNTNSLNEAIETIPHPLSIITGSATAIAIKVSEPGRRGHLTVENKGGAGTRIWGTWTIAWVWN